MSQQVVGGDGSTAVDTQLASDFSSVAGDNVKNLSTVDNDLPITDASIGALCRHGDD